MPKSVNVTSIERLIHHLARLSLRFLSLFPPLKGFFRELFLSRIEGLRKVDVMLLYRLFSPLRQTLCVISGYINKSDFEFFFINSELICYIYFCAELQETERTLGGVCLFHQSGCDLGSDMF